MENSLPHFWKIKCLFMEKYLPFTTPMRNKFQIMKLGLILVGTAELNELFDAIIMQYRLILNFFKLEDAGMVLIRGAKEKGDVRSADLDNAFALGSSIKD